MKSILMRWTFGAVFGLVVSAVGISIPTERAWADTCSGTTIAHGSADCLTASFTHNRRTMTLTNECAAIGVVSAEVRVQHPGDAEPTAGLREVHSPSTITTTLLVNNPGSTYTNARCCPTSGICAITDCDTTDGVIDDTNHKEHCTYIHNQTGAITRPGNEITDGELVPAGS